MEAITLSIATWLLGILAVLIFLYFMSRNNLWMRRYGMTLFLVFWFLGFTVYFIGYFFGSSISEDSIFHAISSLFSAIFSSGRIMAMEIDLKETGSLADYKLYQFICTFVIFSAILLLGATLLTNIGGGVIGRLRLLFLRTIGTRHNIYMIYGLSKETVYLIKDIRRSDKKATILLLHDRSEDMEQIEGGEALENDAFQQGAFRISFSAEKPLLFLEGIAKRCKKNMYLIFMHPVSWKNTSMVQDLLSSHIKNLSRLHLYVLYDRRKSQHIAERGEFQGLDIHWISMEELTARQVIDMPCFLDVCPTDRCRDGRGDFEIRMAIVGYSGVAEELCRYLVSCVQIAGVKVSILLFDLKIGEKSAYFRMSNPEIFKAASIIPIELAPDTEGFYEYFIREEALPDAVFFTGDVGEETMNFAFRLQDVLKNQGKETLPLFVRMESVRENNLALKSVGIHSFGCMEQVYSYEVLIDEELDVIASAIDRYYKEYNVPYKAGENSWQEASIYEKMSSRAHAMHISWKLRCAGFQIVKGENSRIYEEKLKENPLLLENLSKGEHLRWNACLFSEGWRAAKPEEFPKGQHKDEVSKRHACLVSWEELNGVSQYYGRDFYKTDRELVLALGRILENAGYGIQLL